MAHVPRCAIPAVTGLDVLGGRKFCTFMTDFDTSNVYTDVYEWMDRLGDGLLDTLLDVFDRIKILNMISSKDQEIQAFINKQWSAMVTLIVQCINSAETRPIVHVIFFS